MLLMLLLLIRFLIHSIVVVLGFLCILCFSMYFAVYVATVYWSTVFHFLSLYLFLFLFSLLTHCISKIYCHPYLYDLALALTVWLLTLLVYDFPCGDFIVNQLTWMKKRFLIKKWVDVYIIVDIAIEKDNVENSS